MIIQRCRICGEAYVGPSHLPTCPFCGAHAEFLVDGGLWKDENKGTELSELSRKNLEATLEIEISNAQFYRCASKKAENPEVAAMFKSLAKMEAEHADVAVKLLGSGDASKAKIDGACEESLLGNLEASHKREERAIKLYQKFQDEAVEVRLGTVFGALIQIEKDHLRIGKLEIENLTKEEL